VAPLLALIQSAYRGDSARQGWTHEADLLNGQRINAELLGEIVADPGQRLLIAREDDRLLGCVQVSAKENGLAYFGLLTVDPSRQARGLGKRLIDAAEEAARTQFRADRIEITVIRQRSELIAYYERRGYVLTGEERPFPLDDERFGLPRRRDLSFAVLRKSLGGRA
jgi:GNAT superfamily N-acetyltransferase